MHVAQKSTLTRRARDSMHHMLLTANSQVSGHLVAASRTIDVSVDSSLLHVTLEIGFLQRLLLYCCELAEANPLVGAASLRSQPSKLGGALLQVLPPRLEWTEHETLAALPGDLLWCQRLLELRGNFCLVCQLQRGCQPHYCFTQLGKAACSGVIGCISLVGHFYQFASFS